MVASSVMLRRLMAVLMVVATMTLAVQADRSVASARSLLSAGISAHGSMSVGDEGLGRFASNEDQFLTAAENGNVEALTSLLGKNVDVNHKREDGSNALILAAGGGHTDAVTFLLAVGRKKVATGKVGKVAAVVSFGVSRLFGGAKRVDVDAQNNGGRTALMVAAENGKDEVALLLLARGADVDLLSKGETALTLAARAGSATTVEALLHGQAAVDKAAEDGRTPLILAAWLGRDKTVETLLKWHAKDAASSGGWTALMYAASVGNEASARLLLAAPLFNKDAQNTDGNTALTVAVQEQREPIVRVLLEAGANVDLKGPDGTPLMIAVERQANDIVALLLEYMRKYMPKTQAENDDGHTALMIAGENGVEMVRLLLDGGVPVDSQNKGGKTALIIAVEQQRTPIVTFLLANKADKTLKDNSDKTALMWATVKGNTKIMELLK